MEPSLVRSLVELVLPRYCAGCERPGFVLCPACRPRGRPASAPVPGVAVIAAGGYDGGLRRALIGYKERGRHDLVRPLGALLADAARAVTHADGAAAVCLVPVPSSRRAMRERGGDHMLRLTRVAARETELPVVRALALSRRVRDSAGLDRADRAANLAGAFEALPPPRGVSRPGGGAVPLVVDDIVTTGATLREASRALAQAGWASASAAVVAATPLRITPRRHGP